MTVTDVVLEEPNATASPAQDQPPEPDRPDVPLGAVDRHPIVRDSAILPTRSLEAFVNTLRLWLDNLLPGGIVWGHPRVGKSLAIRYVMDNTERLLDAPIPVSLHSSWDPTHSSLSENRFYTALLQAVGYSLDRPATAAILRQRTIDFMIDRARSADEHRYLLFIDEAQWLARVQFRYLMDLHNQLKIADVRLITVLVGQPELLAIKASMRKTGQTQLLGRFMTSTHAYEGVTNQTDFARLCRAIDAQSEYPIGSNVSFTRYFVPRAFEEGWRLEAQASAIWTRLEQIRREQGLSKVDELPMQGLTALLRGLLRTLAAEDADDLVLRRPAIDEGIYGVELHELAGYTDPLSNRAASRAG